MPFDITFLGASREVGRSAFLVKTDKNLLLDYGIKIFGKEGKPEYPDEFKEKLDAMILSHAHLDHSGYIPYLYTFSKTRWFATPPTRDIVELLLADSMKIMGDSLPYDETHYNKALKYWTPAMYEQDMSMGKTTMRMSDAGHICGSAFVELEYENRTLLYTGDFKKEPTRMHSGTDYDYHADVLMIDCTYATREHPDREITEKKLAADIKDTVADGGTVLLPSFALGRSQELIRIIRKCNKKVPIYLDGMGKDITKIYLKNGAYIKDVKGFRKDVESVTMVQGPEDRMQATKEPGVVIATAGMLEGGPALRYLMNLNPDSKILFTGYNVEGTNGWRLLNEGELMIEGNLLTVDLPVGYYDLSAHAGRKDVMETIETVDPEKIVCIHGDSTDKFAEELKGKGYDAIAPTRGEKLSL
jgi:putative mRNA 3-end processing factor